MKNTREAILRYLHDNLSEMGKEVCNVKYKDHWVTEALIVGGIPSREYGFLIPRKVNAGKTFMQIASNAWGDGGHGASLWQIDDRSFPEFIRKHPLSDVKAYMIKAVEVLKEKERYLVSKGWNREKLGDELFERAVIAAYNCGQGNVHKALSRGLDPDRYTFGGDYSRDVTKSRYLYYDLFVKDEDTEFNNPELIAEGRDGAENIMPENAKAAGGYDIAAEGEPMPGTKV